MLNLGFNELLVIVILAIIVVGPDDIPRVMRELGKQYAKIARASDELRRAFLLEADRGEAEARAEDLRKRREEARKRAEQARARAAAARAANGEAALPSDLPGPPGEDGAVPRPVGPTDPPPTPEAVAALAQAAGVAEELPPLEPPPPAPDPSPVTGAEDA